MLYCILLSWFHLIFFYIEFLLLSNVINSLIRFVKFKKNLNVNISSGAIEDNLKSPYKLIVFWKKYSLAMLI